MTVNSPLSAGTGVLSGASSAQSGFGVLHAATSSALTNPGSPVLAYSEADAMFTDIMEIDFTPFTGERGYLVVDFTLDGAFSKSGSFDAFGTVYAWEGNTINQAMVFNSATSGTFEFPKNAFPFVYGTPFNLSFDLELQTGTLNPPNPPGLFTSGRLTSTPGSGSAQFANTLTIQQLTFLDSALNQVSGPVLTSGSGTAYSSATPEPSTVVFSLIGTFLLAALRPRLAV